MAATVAVAPALGDSPAPDGAVHNAVALPSPVGADVGTWHAGGGAASLALTTPHHRSTPRDRCAATAATAAVATSGMEVPGADVSAVVVEVGAPSSEADVKKTTRPAPLAEVSSIGVHRGVHRGAHPAH